MAAKKKSVPAPPPGSLATASVTTPATPQKPTNPFYKQAESMAKKNDRAGLRHLDKQLADAGYAADGTVRTFIANSLGGSK